MKSGILIYSGGLDSTALLYTYRDHIKKCIHFEYGSKHNDSECYFAFRHCHNLGIEIDMIALEFIERFKSNLLIGQGEIPDGHYEDESMKKTVVPFRNAIMLSIAVGVAESEGLSKVYIANHAGDHAIYPDCRHAFIMAMSRASQLGTYSEVVIEAPFNHLTKRQIVENAHKEGYPIDESWSCYKGGKVHCRKCGTCIERFEALEGYYPDSL